MAELRRSLTIRFLILGVLTLTASSWAQDRPPILDKVAKMYGLEGFEQVEAIRYTWNADIPGLFKASHQWEWEPKTNKVTFEGTDKDGKPVKVTYTRFDANQPDAVKNQVEPSFVNDNYWLLFPLHAYWDKSASVIDQGRFNLPTGAGTAELVPVKYNGDNGGYTPGDIWDLYVGKDNRVQYFVYHRGGAKPPSRVFATWEGYKKAGPLFISTEHRGTADGKPLHIWISDLAVKVTGSDNWVKAQ